MVRTVKGCMRDVAWNREQQSRVYAVGMSCLRGPIVTKWAVRAERACVRDVAWECVQGEYNVERWNGWKGIP